MAIKKKKPKSLSSGRPPVQRTRVASLPSRSTRKIIRQHHQLLRAQVAAARTGKSAEAAQYATRIAENGGLEQYQFASQNGQMASRGGDTSRILVSWLQELGIGHHERGGSKLLTDLRLRVLEIGAVAVDNAIAKNSAFLLTRIDLHSTSPAILQQDFMTRPLPSCKNDSFEIISLSLVLNYVPDAATRGAMLHRTTQFLDRGDNFQEDNKPMPMLKSQGPFLFLTLPLPCVSNSRYMTIDHLVRIMAALGYGLVKSKSSAKIYYSLWHLAEPTKSAWEEFRKRELKAGSKRNNFSIVLLNASQEHVAPLVRPFSADEAAFLELYFSNNPPKRDLGKATAVAFMIIRDWPPAAARSASFFTKGSPIKTPQDIIDKDGWSSLIGIITAIVGNVLISIALNTQRYAHIKLNEQWQERKRLLKRAKRRKARAVRSQEEPAKERARSRQQASDGDGPPDSRSLAPPFQEDEDAEREPLLGSYRSDERTLNSGDQASDTEPDSSQTSYLRSPYWWIGIVLMTIGEAGNFLAYGFAPASIVSPLGVVAIISNCIIAPIFMKEKFRWRDSLGVLIAVAGAVTVVLSASDNNPKLGPEQIWHLITRWEFETYLGVTVTLIVLLMLASNKYGQKSIFIDIGLVGLFGGYTALSTKGVASMLSYTLLRALTYPVTYLMVAILVLTAIMQVKYVNRALQRFNATQVIPTQFVMFTLSVIIGSAVLYRDFERTPGQDAGKFVGGCAMTFIGVWLITSGREQSSDEEDEFDDPGEDAIVLRQGETYQNELPGNDSQASIPQTIHEDSEEGSEPTSRARRDRDSSDISLPDSLARNHWRSGVTSTLASTPRSPKAYGTSGSPVIDPTSPGLENPWLGESGENSQSGMSRLLKPLATMFPRLSSQDLSATASQGMYSSPEVPTISRSRSQSGSSGPQTPDRPPRPDYLSTSFQPHISEGLHLHNRHSLTTMYPGAYTSPLSSSLSAIVADSLRRQARRRQLRRTPGSIPRGRENSDAGVEAAAAALDNAIRAQYNDTSPIRSRLRPTRSEDGVGQGRGAPPLRRKSLSDRLNTLFNPGKQRSDARSDLHGDDEPQDTANRI